MEREGAIDRFRDFLRIATVSEDGPKGVYLEAVNFLKNIALKIGLECEIVECVKNKPVLVLTWKGTDPNLPSVLLNSHYDVVPVFPQHWKTAPFGAEMDDKGNIYARGTQDMKCVCMQYIEAIARLKEKGISFRRTIHLTYVPDEEIGGAEGLELFLDTDTFKRMNVGFALDEGLASPTEAFTVFYGERVPWWVSYKATGQTGHGSRFIPNTAVEKLIRIVNKALAFRAEQEALLHGGCSHSVAKKLGDVVTLNLTVLKSYVGGPTRGYAFNVVPNEAEAGFDIRIPPSVNLEDFEKLLKSWAEGEQGVTIDFVNTNRLLAHHVTSTDPEQNAWWRIFNDCMTELKMTAEPEVFPAATDSRFIRKIGIPCLGFSPMNNTPILLHDHNEFINSNTFSNGIKIYENLIPRLANHN